MRTGVKHDDTVRTITATIEDGPALVTGWKTWVKVPRQWRLEHVRITVTGDEVKAVALSGRVIKKNGQLSEAVSESVVFHKGDLARSPEWILTLVRDLVYNVKAATYPTPEDYTVTQGYAA